MQCIGLDAEFYLGAAVLMFPPEWLNLAERYAASRPAPRALTMGVDSGEGQANTAWAIVGTTGVVDLESRKTPDTSEIPKTTVALMKKWGIRASNVLFDAGGGGKQHADYLRSKGHKVRAIAFGGSATPPKSLGVKMLEQRTEEETTKLIFKNRRAEMYGLFMQLLDPSFNEEGFSIPDRFVELRRQLAPLPRKYDGEGRLVLPPKRKPVSSTGKESNVQTMQDLLGCSPDEADAVALGVFGLDDAKVSTAAGRAF